MFLSSLILVSLGLKAKEFRFEKGKILWAEGKKDNSYTHVADQCLILPTRTKTLFPDQYWSIGSQLALWLTDKNLCWLIGSPPLRGSKTPKTIPYSHQSDFKIKHPINQNKIELRIKILGKDFECQQFISNRTAHLKCKRLHCKTKQNKLKFVVGCRDESI